MKIGIIIGSIRKGRSGKAVGDWVARQSARVDDVEFPVLDLVDFDVPLLTAETIPAAANGEYESEAVRGWSAAVASCDGYVFVTPEYNHGVPGGFKNAVDTLAAEWADKTVAFVSYGADSGIRAVEQWRQIAGNLRMLDVRAQVSLSLYRDFQDGEFSPTERRDAELVTLFGQLVALTRKVRT